MRKIFTVFFAFAIILGVMPAYIASAASTHVITNNVATYDVDGGGGYATLKDAIDTCADGDVIQFGDGVTPLTVNTVGAASTDNNLTKSATYTGSVELSGVDTNPYGIVIPAGVTATFSNLQIQNASGTEATANYYCTVYVAGSLNVESGTAITANVGGSNNGDAIFVDTTGILTVNGGTISTHTTETNPVNNVSQANAINNYGTLTVNGGTISTDSIRNVGGNFSSAIFQSNISSGTTTVTGGTITGAKSGIKVKNAGANVLRISGGIIEATTAYYSTSAVSLECGTITMTGGTVRATNTIGMGMSICNSGVLNISDGTISSTATLLNEYVAAIYMRQGTINVSGNANITGAGYGISTVGQGTINISGGTVESTGAGRSAIYGSDSVLSLNMTGGTVRATDTTANDNYGICLQTDNASQSTLDISDGTVSTVGTGIFSSAIYLDAKSGIANISGTAIIDSAANNTLTLGNDYDTGGSKFNVFGKEIYSNLFANIAVTGGTVASNKEINNTNYGSATVNAINIIPNYLFKSWTSDLAGNTEISTTNGDSLAFMAGGVTTIYLKLQPVTVPDAPTGVSAAAGNGQATVSFTAPVNDGGGTITGYTIKVYQGGILQLASGTGASSPIAVNGLTNGTAYTFKVYATNSIGNSADSIESSPVTPATVPDAPTGVSATAGNGQATVSFTPPVNNGGANITLYQVNAYVNGQLQAQFSTTGASTPITVTGLTNGTAYTFTVKAQNSVGYGAESAPSAGVTPYHHSSGGYTPPATPPATPPETPPETPSVTLPAQPSNGVDVIVNDKTVTAATSNTEKVEDKTVTTIIVDEDKIEQKLNQEGKNATVVIPINNKSDVAVGELTGQTVKNMETKDDVLQIKTDNVTYTFPASEINIDNVSEQIGKQVELKDIKVQVQIAAPSVETAKVVEDTASKGNYQVVVKPVEFDITCSSGDKTVNVSKFNSYVERTVAIPDGIDPSKITTGIVLNEDGTFSHVPTIVTIIDGKYYAKINSLTNSTYSVIYNPKTFKDVENHWSKDAVNDMGSRLIIDGVGNGNFEPDRDITRAEFAAIVVRGLGLMRSNMGKACFSDVTKDKWYYDAVAIASDYKLITGYADGTFLPDNKITREEAMAIIARAMRVANMNTEISNEEYETLLSKFKDGSEVSEWAKNSVANCVKNQIVAGYNGNITAKNNITRAEVAAIVQRMLRKANLIN